MAVLIYVPYKTFILFNFVQFTLYKECGNFLSGAIRKIALCTQVLAKKIASMSSLQGRNFSSAITNS